MPQQRIVATNTTVMGRQPVITASTAG